MDAAQKRQIAYKVRISDILNSNYVKEEGWTPNYAVIGEKQVSRVNLIGAVISTGEETIVDDGSGSIVLRSFEPFPMDFNVGELVLVIGKIREFSSQKYIAPEIIKKADEKIAKLRALELEKQDLLEPKKETTIANETPHEPEIREVTDVASSVEEEVVVEESVEASDGTHKKVYELIKNLDSGEGADFEEVINQANEGDTAEKDIDFLLKRGEIFEVKPGRLKVLG